ncbi:epoxyqueuosine reductase QueH [Desulfovibrio sp. ZJ200]|uniref:epoxyqueuosine reductase QueH n=1 Tax=Desulfovibrio sp. ZJ200 TaxID=2709792 RepID=UPI0013EC4516|nr:epoxyqueuosine reductase QueH [Desulfovibrio sp. ZJ200]
MPGNSDPRLNDAALPDQTASSSCPRPSGHGFRSDQRGPKSLLLHVCCGPCAIMPLSRLLDEGFALTAWFMNPNIHPLTEYLRRREAAGECAARLGVDILYADETWDITAWLRAVAGRDVPPSRCAFCCESRLAAAFAKARELGFAWVSTSLLYSRYQPHETIAAAGQRLTQTYAARPENSEACDRGGPAFLYRDFRTDWQAGIDRSKAWGLYRQPYCGCVYSEADRYRKRLVRLTQHAARQ